MSRIIAVEKDSNLLILSKTPELICWSTITGGSIVLANAAVYVLGLEISSVLYQVSLILSIILFAIPILEEGESCIIDKSKGLLYLCKTSPFETLLALQKRNKNPFDSWSIKDIVDVCVRRLVHKSQHPTVVAVLRTGEEKCLITSEEVVGGLYSRLPKD